MISLIYETQGDKKVATAHINNEVLSGVNVVDFLCIANSVRDDISTFIVDLQDVEILNSSALGALVKTFVLLKRKNVDLEITNTNEHILELLQMTRLDTIVSKIN